MKFTKEKLEKLKYNPKTGKWYNKNYISYIKMESCKSCGEPYLTLEKNIGDYCCRICSGKSKIGKYRSKETINKIIKSKIGNKNPMYGKKHSKETRKIMSESFRKENNPKWDGGYNSKNIPKYNTYAHQIEYTEKVRRNKEDKNILEVKCAYCGKWYIPTIYNIYNRINSLNGKGTGESRLYCSNTCKKECPIFNQKKYPKGYKKMSSREVQPELRQMVFERDNWECKKCGSTKSLHCHHVEGIRWEPLESADIDKCITYCKECHKEVHQLEECSYQDMQCKEKLYER